MQPQVIAIDGPAASGKDTVGRMLADQLGYTFFDTGVMYRAVAWLAIEKRIDPGDANAVAKLARESDIKLGQGQQQNGQNEIILNGADVSQFLRAPEVDSAVSLVAQVREVRDALAPKQRSLAERGRIVMAGRDIGTKILPDAPIKIYLEASLEERAKRRFAQSKKQGQGQTLPQVLAMIRERDRIDTERSESPLRPADDAVIINTDKMDPKAVVNAILERIRDRCHSAITPQQS